MQWNRAILVDDEVFTRKGFLKLIDWEACGFQIVDEADNGEDALELIERLQPDVVITDIRMPVLDGLELIRHVVMKDIVKPYFIIVSGYDDFNYAQQAVRYGVHDFILKPIDETEFSHALVRLSERLELDREARMREERLMSGALMESLIIGKPMRRCCRNGSNALSSSQRVICSTSLSSGMTTRWLRGRTTMTVAEQNSRTGWKRLS